MACIFTVRYACPRCGMEWADTDTYRAHIDAGAGPALCPPVASDAVPDLQSVVVVRRGAAACNMLLPPRPAARAVDVGDRGIPASNKCLQTFGDR